MDIGAIGTAIVFSLGEEWNNRVYNLKMWNYEKVNVISRSIYDVG